MNSARLAGVGFFVVIGIVLFGVGLFMIGERRMLFQDSLEVHAYFGTLSGLQVGAQVRVAGMQAGEVMAIDVPPGPSGQFRVRLRIIEKLHPLVRTNSVATIQTDGLIGNDFVQVSVGTETQPQAPPGSTIQSKDPFAFADLLQQLSDTVDQVNATIDEFEADVKIAIRTVTETTSEVDNLVEAVGEDVKAIARSGNEIAGDIQVIARGIREGEGTVGKLLTDPELFEQMREVSRDASETSENVRSASENLQSVMEDVEASQIVEETEAVIRDIRQVTEKVKTALDQFQPEEGEGEDTMQNVRMTLKHARDAMSSIAENAEALKRNWFFRGFFRNRGFYDLETLTVDQYRDEVLGSGERRPVRYWLTAEEVFSSGPDNERVISDVGKTRIKAIMAELLRYPMPSALVVEGYADSGPYDERYLESRNRARILRDYILEEYDLLPNYTGSIAMADSAVNSPSGSTWDGISLVLLVPRDAQRNP